MCPTSTSPRPDYATSEFRRAFNVIDTDHDGKISGEDLRTFFAGACGGEEDQMISVMIEIADANKDGYVQYDEFERVLKKWNNEKGNKRVVCYGDSGVMEEVFRVMDEDGDGRLGLDDLRRYFGRVGLTVGDEEIRAMIGLGGGDESLGVSFDGFVDILAHQIVT